MVWRIGLIQPETRSLIKADHIRKRGAITILTGTRQPPAAYGADRMHSFDLSPRSRKHLKETPAAELTVGQPTTDAYSAVTAAVVLSEWPLCIRWSWASPVIIQLRVLSYQMDSA